MALQNLDLEEQEQLATLKGWWKDNGRTVLGLLTVAALALAGWQGWRYYQRVQAVQSGSLYESLLQGARAGDAKAVRDASGTLVESYPRTLYAAMGALAAARFHADRGDLKSAKAQLQWVIERASAREFAEMARLRLAALLLDEKEYDAALKLLEEKTADAFAAQAAALKGDVLAAKQQPADAKAAYRLALEKADPKSDAFRANVQLRLDALGG